MKRPGQLLFEPDFVQPHLRFNPMPDVLGPHGCKSTNPARQFAFAAVNADTKRDNW